MLSFVLLLSLFAQSVEPVVAADLPQVYADEITAEAGETVTVPIKILNNTGLVGFCLIMEYDQDVFTPIAVNSGELTQAGILDDSIETSTDNTFKIIWANTEDVAEDGTLVNVDFTVSEYARGTQSIAISYSQPDTFNESWEDVVLDCTPVQVTVEKPQIQDAHLYSEDNLTVNEGETIDVPIILDNNTELTEGGFDVQYDQSVFLLENIVASDGVNVEHETVQSGEHFLVSGLDTSVGTQTLVTLRFKVDEYVSGSYKFDIISEDMETIPFTVEVNNPHNSEGAYVYGGEITTTSKQITVPVMIKNNAGLVGFKMNVQYNPELMEPVSITGGTALSGSFADNIGLYDDYFTVLWTGTEDVIGNTTLFSITFNVVEGVESIEDELVLEYSQEDTFNESWEDVALNLENISIRWEKSKITLSEITVAKETTNYVCGDVLSLDDMIVKAVYSDGNVAEISNYTTNIQEIDMNVAGEKRLIITYEEEGVIKSAELMILVSEKSENGQNPSGPDESTKPSTPNNPTEEEKYPEVGMVKTLSSGVFKVKTSTATSKTVVYVKPKNKKKTSVTIPATVTIDGYTYQVTEIAAKAFKGNSKIKNLVIGSNVVKIGNEAFANCKNLKKVTIGKHVTTIGKKAFYNCKKLKSITIKSKVLKTVGKNAIKNIYKKATIKVPKQQLKKYKKLFKSKTGYKKTMKIKK